MAAEDIWLKLKNEKDEESVHLTEWPEKEKINTKSLEDMQKVRDIVTLGLEARQKAGIKVRQPLLEIRLKEYDLEKEYTKIIKDELNVKIVMIKPDLQEGVELNTEIGEELKQEGNYRELVRAMQDMRKKIGLTPSDVISVIFETDENGKKLIQKFENDMKKTVLASEIEFEKNDGDEVKIEEFSFKIKIKK